jgi:hypothetical protein
MLLGLNSVIANTKNVAEEYLITPTPGMETNDLYILSCDEMAVNGFSNNGPLKALQFIHTYNGYSTNAIVHRGTGDRYFNLEGSLLSSFTFRLYKESGYSIFLNNSSTIFNVIVHIRRK